MVHVVLDSTANAPQELLDQWPNLHIVPLTILLHNRHMPENELSAAEMFRLMKETGCHPKTSQPALGEFVQLFARLIDAGHTVVVITVSGGLSGTVEGAKTAAQMTGSKNVYVIDSCTTAIGMVKMAEEALAMGQEGYTASEIAAKVQAMADVTHTIIVPSTLEYLHRGGRIGGASALLGTILQIRPVLYLDAGRVAVLDKVRTRAKAVARLIEVLGQYKQLAYISVVHIEAAAEAVELQRQMQEKYPHIPVLIGTGASALAAHLGPGLIGFIFQETI